MSTWKEVRERASRRWQLPVLVVSLVLLVKAGLRLAPAPTDLPPDEAIRFLAQQVEAGLYGEAVELGERLLTREDLSDADRALVHRQLGRAWYGYAQAHDAHTPAAGARVAEHFEYVTDRGLTLEPSDQAALGRAYVWQGRYAQAAEQFRRALARGVDDAVELRRDLLALELDRLKLPPSQMLPRLKAFTDEAGSKRLDLVLWAIERQVELLDETGASEEAATLLARNRDRFYNSDLRDRFAYREAWLMYRTGHSDEAEAHLRAIRNRVDRHDEVDAMSGWLLGRVVLRDDGPQRPQEALSFFDDVIREHPNSPYAVASRIGAGEALDLLQRYDEAAEQFRLAIEDLPRVRDHRLVGREELRTTLGVIGEVHRREGRLKEAVMFMRIGASLIHPQDGEQAMLMLELLGQTQVQLAEQIEAKHAAGPGQRLVDEWNVEANSPEAREVLAEAAETYRKLAQMNVIHERRAGQAAWMAAELFARAGRRTRAIHLFETFVKERPSHPRVPRALLRIGQLRQLAGDLEGAVEAYRTCYRRFPRTLDGSRALVPLARCYLALGNEYEELAEKTLRIVLEQSEVFTPAAPEFAAALFLYGDGLNRSGKYNEAIAALEEAIERYPDDPRSTRARYLLADSYRKSGLLLKAEAAKASTAREIERMRDEASDRFQRAARLYRALIDAYELRPPSSWNRLERMYRRHAYLYEADCYFETGDYRKALTLYREAADLFQETPSALAAYVQIINCHVFLGEPDEARTALARAEVLVDALPEEAFAGPLALETRDDWKRYFKWLEEAELF